MCSELLRIPYDWAGVPIFGFGVLLAVWAAASLATMIGLVRRYGWSAETWSTVPVLLLAGAAILLLPRVFPDGLPIRGYGLMLLAGIVAGVSLAIYRARQVGVDPDIFLSLAVWLVVSGLVGARLFYVIEYWDEKFAGRSPSETLLEIINIPEGGLVIYGGFIGALIGIALFVRKYKLPILAVADLVAPSFMIGLALGRIGCFLNGCCYGGPSDYPWAVTFPQYSSRYETVGEYASSRFSPPYADQAARGEFHGFRVDARDGNAVIVSQVVPNTPAAEAGLKPDDAIVAVNGERLHSLAHAKEIIFGSFLAKQQLQLTTGSQHAVEITPIVPPPRSRPIHPTQLYSAIDAGLLAWVLWAIYPFRTRDGQVFALMLTIHPVTRFLLEIIRTDEPAVFGTGMSISQNISLILLAAAAGLWWQISRQPARLAWQVPKTSESGKTTKPNDSKPRT